MAWYPGMEGGRAVADVLLGVEEPGGRLPFAIPTDAWHLPYFDAEAKHIVYDAWWGQRQLDRDGHPAAFPFGHGLGYSTFTFQLVHHLAGQTAGTATVRVHNTGDRAGATVVQVYAFDDGGAATGVPAARVPTGRAGGRRPGRGRGRAGSVTHPSARPGEPHLVTATRLVADRDRRSRPPGRHRHRVSAPLLRASWPILRAQAQL